MIVINVRSMPYETRTKGEYSSHEQLSRYLYSWRRSCTRAGGSCHVITFNKILGGAEDPGRASFRPVCVIEAHRRIVIPLLQAVIRSGYPRSFLSMGRGWGIERSIRGDRWSSRVCIQIDVCLRTFVLKYHERLDAWREIVKNSV